MYTKAPLIGKRHLWVTAVKHVCCNVWTVLIFYFFSLFLGTTRICNIIYLILSSIYLGLFFFFGVCNMQACHLWQRNIAWRALVALGFRVTTKEALSPITSSSSLFVRRLRPLQSFFAASQHALHVMENHVWGEKVLQCSSSFWDFSTSQLSWWLMTNCR